MFMNMDHFKKQFLLKIDNYTIAGEATLIKLQNQSFTNITDGKKTRLSDLGFNYRISA